MEWAAEMNVSDLNRTEGMQEKEAESRATGMNRERKPAGKKR